MSLNIYYLACYHDDLQIDELKFWDKTEANFNSLKTTLQYCLPYIRYFQIPSNEILKKIKLYNTILEKSNWDDILTKNLDPNTPVSKTSLILPNRTKITIQLPSRYPTNNVTPSTIILQQVTEISSSIIILQHLLLKGSRDGFIGDTFHKLYDNIPGTIKGPWFGNDLGMRNDKETNPKEWNVTGWFSHY
ncbi:hypothetical protein C2G38_2112806, partial [Gigaspora rosea]